MDQIAVKRFVTTEFHTAEAIKILRTNLIFSGPSVRAVALTSSGASQGKSTLSFQLAASMAENGKRVLLMDADLRKTVLASRLRAKGVKKGLSHYLSGLADVNEAINATDIPGFYIMFAGALVPNSAELLGSDNFRKLIPALKEAFDYIIVDAAPLGLVIDAAVMAPVLDGVIMVVNASNNSYKEERRVKAQLEKSGGKILGVVLNQVNFGDKAGYYRKAYSAGYGYGYGESTGNV